jgi:hypothetical protein
MHLIDSDAKRWNDHLCVVPQSGDKGLATRLAKLREAHRERNRSAASERCREEILCAHS